MELAEIAKGRVSEAENFLARGAAYSGFVRLGDALRVVDEMKSRERNAWRARILEKARGVDLQHVNEHAADAVARVSRILSTGGTYDAYEIVLLLTLRVELESAQVLLAALDDAPLPVPRSIDDDLRALRADRWNTRAYEAAAGMVRRNWGVPLTSEWLT